MQLMRQQKPLKVIEKILIKNLKRRDSIIPETEI
jgi:hypothetical protein